MDHKQLSVCTDCLHALARHRVAPRSLRRTHLAPFRSLTTTARLSKNKQSPTPVQYVGRPSTTYTKADVEPKQRTPKPETAFQSHPSIPQEELDIHHGRVQELCAIVLQPTDGPVPAEQRVLYALEQLDAIAARLMDPRLPAPTIPVETTKRGGSATSALLGAVSIRKTSASTSRASLIALIGSKAEDIVRSTNTTLTSSVLETYVQLQSTLQRPDSFPAIFELYATKGDPQVQSDGQVILSASRMSSPKSVSYQAASKALAAAITAHNLTLALAIIDCSFATPIYTRNKTIRQAGIPGAAFAAFPLVAYGASLQFSSWQTMLDPGQATTMAFAGFMTYAAAVGSVGYVAITTANDQMDRVTWVLGTPLWERWIREDERAALDKVAAAWGFKSVEKRGDEEGSDWEQLRETCGIRGMILDKVELMEGME